MTTGMTRWERVQAAIKGQDIDRLPVTCGDTFSVRRPPQSHLQKRCLVFLAFKALSIAYSLASGKVRAWSCIR